MNRIPQESSSGNGKEHHYDRLWEAFGYVLGSPNPSGEAIAEECPWCHKDKCHLNVTTGLYNCKHCDESGNAYTFIRWEYKTLLEGTTDAHYRVLKDMRGLPLQTAKRHGLAYFETAGYWLIPFKDKEGEVMNLLRHDIDSNRKWNLPEMSQYIYGLDQLHKEKPEDGLLVCEGPTDAIAVDQHLRENKTRDRYDILAVPSATTFRKDWLPYLKGYKWVRLLFDNDKAGKDGQIKVAKLVKEEGVDCKLFALEWPQDRPDGYDQRDLIRDGGNVIKFSREHCKRVAVTEPIILVRGDRIKKNTTEWLMEGRIPLKTMVSLSGDIGTGKSTIARYLAAMVTTGEPMIGCTTAIPAANVIYFTSEDSKECVNDIVALHGGDVTRLFVHDIIDSENPLDLLESLEGVESIINEKHAPFVVFDAFNSFIGEGANIKGDHNARRTLTNKVMGMARRTGSCILILRNWGKVQVGTATDKVLGASSLSAVSRCVMNTQRISEDDELPKRFQLEFQRVSDAPDPEPLRFTFKDKSTCDEDKHLRIVEWDTTDIAIRNIIDKASAAYRKGSKKG